MSSWWNIEPYDLFRKFFGNELRRLRTIGDDVWFIGDSVISDMYRDFEVMRMEMEREFDDQFSDIELSEPNQVVREYESHIAKLRGKRMSKRVYSYSVAIDSDDDRPRATEFGNLKSHSRPFSSKTDSLIDIITTNKEVKVIAEIPGLSKENMKISVYDNLVEILDDTPNREYRHVIDLPQQADIKTAKSKYNNGILEITFNKKGPHRRKKIHVQ